ncbi:hypothetical protein ACFYY5_29065 [Nocardia elegans]|uniref:Uncharacterized protein n=1 Tax=Nocardia elegans TaxID=300029 RepID=A0ABW6TNU6_9NOCA
MSEQCWCGRPSHPDLLDGCVGDLFLQAMFGPPTLNTMISNMITAYGDIVVRAVEGDEEAAAYIHANPIPKPSIEQDQTMLKLAGMDVTADDIESLRDWYGRKDWNE